MHTKYLPYERQWNTTLHVKREFRKKVIYIKVLKEYKSKKQTNKITYVKNKCHSSILY